MRINRLVVSNFKSLRSFDTGDLPNGIIGIVGDNGQGKSTLLSAISYALYGPEALATGRADAITWGEKKAEVNLWFESENDEYLLVRTQDNKGNSKATLLSGLNLDHNIASGPHAVNAEIQHMLGVDLVGFQASVFSKQDDLLGLGSLQSSKRVSTMLRLLGIDTIDKAIEYINKKSKEFKSELEVMRRTVESMPELDVDKTKALIAQTIERQRMLEAQIEPLNAKAAEYMSERDALSATYQKWVAHQSSQDRIRGQIITADKAIERLQGEAVEPAEPVKPFILIDPKDYSRRTAEYAARANALRKAKESSVCPTCGRPFDGADESHLAEEEKTLNAILQGIESDAPAAFESDKYFKELESYKQFLLPRFNDAKRRMAEATKAKEELTQELINLGEFWEDPTDAYHAAVSKYNELAEESRALVHEVNLAMQARSLYEKELAKYEGIQKTYESNLQRIKALEAEVVDYTTCSSELASFKTAMVSGVIPSLSESASTLIAQITDGKYSEVSLTPQYDIQYRNELGDLKSFPNLSGGEQDAFALAMRLAIADLRASRIGVLVLDEVFESLDSDKQESTWQALEKMSSRFTQVFLVTHVAAFKDRAPYTINL